MGILCWVTKINMLNLNTMAAILQTLSTAFPWKKIFYIWIQISLTFVPQGLVDPSHKSHNAPCSPISRNAPLCKRNVHAWSHKSHNAPCSPISRNAPLCNRNVHACTFLLQSGALWDICLMHCGICEIGLMTNRGQASTCIRTSDDPVHLLWWMLGV